MTPASIAHAAAIFAVEGEAGSCIAKVVAEEGNPSFRMVQERGGSIVELATLDLAYGELLVVLNAVAHAVGAH